jgi:hypothetical protein
MSLIVKTDQGHQYGPFSNPENAEYLVLRLAGMEGVGSVQIEADNQQDAPKPD